jgi:hypothetical protein
MQMTGAAHILFLFPAPLFLCMAFLLFFSFVKELLRLFLHRSHAQNAVPGISTPFFLLLSKSEPFQVN